MPIRKNVFIVGAGASNEVKFPLGSELKTEIASAYTLINKAKISFPVISDKVLRETLTYHFRTLGEPAALPKAMEVCQEIGQAMSSTSSIDGFLNNHQADPDIQLYGKLAIARLILSSEEDRFPSLNGKPNLDAMAGTWFSEFFKLLISVPVREIVYRLDTISFVVFNYDRCIQHYLRHAFQIAYRLDEDAAHNLVDRIEFIHPYGSLGLLPWQYGSDNVPFGAKLSCENLIKVSSNIKTFTESTDARIVEKIQTRLHSAANIIFLGFGFWENNMELLTAADIYRSDAREAQVYATRIGISASDFSFIKNQVEEFRGAALLNFEHRNCAGLIAEHSRAFAKMLKP